MHCLEVIIARNDRAAGREAAHADNDWNDREASAILEATFEQAAKEGKSELPEHYVAGFLSGRKEG